MRRLLWYGNSSGSDRNPNSSDNHVCLSVQSYGTYCQHTELDKVSAEKAGDVTANKFGIKIALNLTREAPGIDEEAPKCVTQTIAPHAGKAIYPRLAGFAVDQHEAVAVPAGRDAVAIADVRALDIECRFGQSQGFTMTPAFEVNDVADGQKRVSGVFDFHPGP
jgi:hypothetical protein